MAADPTRAAGGPAARELSLQTADVPGRHHRSAQASNDNVAAWLRSLSDELSRLLALVRAGGNGVPPETAPGPAPIAPAAPAPVAPPPRQDVVDAHLVWERQLAKLAKRDLRRVDEATLAAVCDQMVHLEDLILGTPARTLAGAMAQLRRVAASIAERDPEAREPGGLRLALATLAQLSGA
jgi:hypothetical protein